jgi:hypothetical protein
MIWAQGSQRCSVKHAALASASYASMDELSSGFPGGADSPSGLKLKLDAETRVSVSQTR